MSLASNSESPFSVGSKTSMCQTIKLPADNKLSKSDSDMRIPSSHHIKNGVNKQLTVLKILSFWTSKYYQVNLILNKDFTKDENLKYFLVFFIDKIIENEEKFDKKSSLLTRATLILKYSFFL